MLCPSQQLRKVAQLTEQLQDYLVVVVHELYMHHHIPPKNAISSERTLWGPMALATSLSSATARSRFLGYSLRSSSSTLTKSLFFLPSILTSIRITFNYFYLLDSVSS